MVSCSKKGFVATVSLGRADTQNRINLQFAGAFKDIRDEIRRDKDVRVVIITGEARDVFCTGTDTEAFHSSADSAILLNLLSIASIIDPFTCPVIAAINGAAFGQGLELSLACDLRICSQNAVFGMPQIASGRMPWDGGTQRLSRLVGRGKALEMILLGETVDAREALRIGLVHKITSPDELMGIVQEMAHRMAEQSPISLAYAKEAVIKGMDLTLDQGLRLEADLYYLMHTTRDRTEGITAFREKRRPQFEGE